LGLIEFGWKNPLRLENNMISLEEYPRYASPYAQAEFPAEHISITLDDQSLVLDWIQLERKASNFI
jgi:hypothetical protein